MIHQSSALIEIFLIAAAANAQNDRLYVPRDVRTRQTAAECHAALLIKFLQVTDERPF